MELISRTNVENKLSASLDHLAAEVLVLDSDDEHGGFIRDTQRPESKLDVALPLPRCGNKVEAGGCRAVCLGQWDFMQHIDLRSLGSNLIFARIPSCHTNVRYP